MANIKTIYRGMQNGAETINNNLEAINSELTSGGNVVHKTGDETIAGKKTFSNDVEIRGTLNVSSLTTTLDVGNGLSIKFTKNGLGLVQAKFQGTLTTVKHGEEMRGTNSTWVSQNFCPPETISLVGHFASGSDSFHIDIETTGRVVYWGPDTLTADARGPRGSALYFAK